MSNPRGLLLALLMVLALAAAACSDGSGATATSSAEDDPLAADHAAERSGCAPSDSAGSPDSDMVVEVATATRDELDLGAVLVRVTRGDDDVVTFALGESSPGVPATVEHRFRNGAIVFSYLGTMLLQLEAEGVVDLDEPVDRWLPDLPHGDRLTLRMLAASTSGLVDFVPMETFVADLYDDPFRSFTLEELQEYVFAEPLAYEPGTNWSYSHLNFHLLGRALEAATDEPLAGLLATRIIEPMGLSATESVPGAELSGPFLRTFTDERGRREESTSWSAAWGVPDGAVLVTDICDLAISAGSIGRGDLLAADALDTLIDPGTVGVGEPTDGCPQCRPMTEELHFGLGVLSVGDWIIQTPLFTGIAAIQAYLPDEDLAIAVANTFGPEADVDVNGSTEVFRRLAAELAPDAELPEF